MLDFRSCCPIPHASTDWVGPFPVGPLPDVKSLLSTAGAGPFVLVALGNGV